MKLQTEGDRHTCTSVHEQQSQTLTLYIKTLIIKMDLTAEADIIVANITKNITETINPPCNDVCCYSIQKCSSSLHDKQIILIVLVCILFVSACIALIFKARILCLSIKKAKLEWPSWTNKTVDELTNNAKIINDLMNKYASVGDITPTEAVSAKYKEYGTVKAEIFHYIRWLIMGSITTAIYIYLLIAAITMRVYGVVWSHVFMVTLYIITVIFIFSWSLSTQLERALYVQSKIERAIYIKTMNKHLDEILQTYVIASLTLLIVPYHLKSNGVAENILTGVLVLLIAGTLQTINTIIKQTKFNLKSICGCDEFNTT